LNASQIADGVETVKHIDFAVPYNITEDLQDWVLKQGLSNNIIPFDMTAQEASDIIQISFTNVDHSGLESFFNSLAGGCLTALVLHTLVESFLVYKGAKESSGLFNNILEDTSCTTGGLVAGVTAELILQKINITGSTATFGLVFLISLSTRGILKRLIHRRGYEDFLYKSNLALQKCIMYHE